MGRGATLPTVLVLMSGAVCAAPSADTASRGVATNLPDVYAFIDGAIPAVQ